MKNNYRRLGVMLSLFQGCSFYCYTVYETTVCLQGRFHSDIVKKAQKLRFKVNINEQNGYVELTRNLYTITLTE
jgi:hypothetical protein